MRISDWSSDVCSSDLQGVVSFIESGWRRMPAFTPAACRIRFDLRLSPRTSAEEADSAVDMQLQTIAEVGRESCRERVCQYVKNRVVPVTLKTKKNHNRKS